MHSPVFRLCHPEGLHGGDNAKTILGWYGNHHLRKDWKREVTKLPKN